MTIEEIKAARSKAEAEIFAILAALEAVTGMQVTSCGIAHDFSAADPYPLRAVNVEVKL